MKGAYFFAILAYVFLLWLTGFLVTKKSRSSEAYLLASRSLSVPLVSVLIAGTWLGGVSVVGMAQGAYIHGISALWFQAGIWVAMFITALLFEKIIQGRTTYSILDIVGNLYGKRTAQVAGLLQFVFMVWVVTMNIVGGGAILSFILKRLSYFWTGHAADCYRLHPVQCSGRLCRNRLYEPHSHWRHHIRYLPGRHLYDRQIPAPSHAWRILHTIFNPLATSAPVRR